MTDKPLHVALLWHALNHANLGIDALTRSNMAIVRAAAARAGRTVRFTTLGSRPYPGEVPDGATVGPRAELKPMLLGRAQVQKAMRGADLAIDIGEGDSWADIYGGRRFLLQSGLKLSAVVLGIPLVLAPQTIGPFHAAWRRRASNAIMSRARAVFARDGLSMAYLQQQHLRTETAEFVDVAFRLPFDRQPKADGRHRVGLNVSGLLYRGGYTGKNEFGLTIDYSTLTHRLIEAFMAMDNVEVHLIPHVLGENAESDLGIIPELIERHPGLVLPAPFISASAAKSYMSGLDFVTGARMHACIGAFSARVPVMPIAYSRKFNGLFDTLNYAHYVDGKVATTDAAFEAVLAAFVTRDRLAEGVARGMIIAEDRLAAYESRLTAIIATLPTARR
jgi:colanic acid/amylovoran biosynthesis protein